MSTPFLLDWPAYDDELSCPWIARIDNWDVGCKPTHHWGIYIGSAAGGRLEVSAERGDLVRWGQRTPRDSDNYWYAVPPQYAVVVTSRRYRVLDDVAAADYVRRRAARQKRKPASAPANLLRMA